MAREFDELQPTGFHPGRLNPIDPSVDTFRQRWAPFSSDPVGDFIEQQQMRSPPRIAPPGTRERFGDPTKVLSQADTGVKSDAQQPYESLPPGFTQVPRAEPQGLPPGFTQVPRAAPQPAPPEIGGAARGTVGRREGPLTDAISNFLPQVGAGIKAGFNQFLQDAGGKLQEPQNALPAALGGPLAPGIAAMRGGAALARGLSEGGFAGVDQAATGKMVQGAVGPDATRLSTVADLKSPEDAIGRIVNLARTGGPEDLKAIAQLRKVIPADKHAEVQAALVNKLGQSDSGDFAAETFVRNYGQVSDRAKNILFGQSGSGSLRNHLDNISEVTERMGQIRGPSNTAIALTAGAAAMTPLGPIGGPLAVLGTVVPARTLARALTSPATAASVAAWSRAYERAVRSGGNAALVSYNIATRNLNNTLGTDVGGARGQPVE